MEKTPIIEKLNDKSFRRELDELFDFIMFNNEDKKKYLDMLMQCKGLKNDKTVMETLICSCIAEEMGKKMHLTGEEMANLYYGVLTHDIGMLAIPKEIMDLDRQLTPEETSIIRKHIEIEEKILKVRLKESVAQIAATHHERADGSGYPKGLKDKAMNDPQRILQLADSVTAMLSIRPYRGPMDKSAILKSLADELKAGHFNRRVVAIFTDNYDAIMDKVLLKSEHLIEMNQKLEVQYQNAISHLKG